MSIIHFSWMSALAVVTGYGAAELIHRLRRRLLRRRATTSITMGVHVVTVPKSIALAERGPGDVHTWYGYWDHDEMAWTWAMQHGPLPEDTHWIPAHVQVLPARCCPPEVE